MLAGYAFIRRRLIFAAWVLLAASIVAVYLTFVNYHPILQMLAIIATTFNGMKVIAVAEGYKNKPLTLTYKQWLTYAIGWVGMRAQPFETLGKPALPGGRDMVVFGISRIVFGGLLLLAAHGIVALRLAASLTYVLVTPVLLVGLSLILHFGFLSISAGMWRFSGVNTYYLFRQPAKALSLTELWSKRWNIAFSEMTSVAIFRPLRKRVGTPVALMISFIFSGFLHELALSLPVNAGYGLPTLYFAIQGALVIAERSMQSRGITLLQNKLVARVWVFFWLIVPMPLLFHEQFIKQVVWPLAGL
ncbi:hypothetical protein BC343_18005 [Mucilaginibacter pedocola]|uniref:Wax synthase domain-containing protein n=1 Tax=Mucilaginibacter pedocola TaxID=1792845 RepID=A0A1S9P8G6_9SPHI|nr:hypothetical protein BC343_18005 [Mucilaginibacter pedocola]